MIITDTDFANKELLERVKHGETIEVQHDGQTVALMVAPGRITNVDPLPDEVLERIYSQPDELDGVTARQLAEFQSQKEPN